MRPSRCPTSCKLALGCASLAWAARLEVHLATEQSFCVVGVPRASGEAVLTMRRDLDGDAGTPCDPARCNADTFHEFLVAARIDEGAGKGSCGCWERKAVDQHGASTEESFLFSYSTRRNGGRCTARDCWNHYSQVLHAWSTGNLTSNLSWTASCWPLEDLERHCATRGEYCRDDDLPSVAYLVSELEASGEADTVSEVLGLVSLEDELSEMEVRTLEQRVGRTDGAVVGSSATVRSVLAKIVAGWDHLTTKALDLLKMIGVGALEGLTGSSSQVMMGSTFTLENYYKPMLGFFVAGMTGEEALQEWFDAQSGNATVKTGPGPNTTVYYSWDDVALRLRTICDKLVSGKAVRQNELGKQILNGVMWPNAPGGERTIFLGANTENHAYARPLLAQVLDGAEEKSADCDGSRCWNKEWLRQFAHDFLAERFQLSNSDFKWYVTKILHKVHLNMDLSDHEAREFAEFMGNAILPIPFTEGQANSMLVKSALGIPETQGKRSVYLEKYRKAIRAKFSSQSFTDAKADLVASAFLDSLQFAGGLSVPKIIEYVIALTHMKEENKWEELKGLKLTPENIPQIVWETMRLHPPVGGFAYWENEGNDTWKHHVLNFNKALLDEQVFKDARTFKFRPIEVYHRRSVGFADIAVQNVQGFGEVRKHDRNCPGKELALAIASTFLEEFAALGPWYATDDDITVNSFKASAYVMMRQDKACWRAHPKCGEAFVYKGRKYHGCSSVDYEDKGAWCATDDVYSGSWKRCTPQLCARSPCCCKYKACSATSILEGYAQESHDVNGHKMVCCKRYASALASGECPGNWLFGKGYYEEAERVDPETGDDLCPAHDFGSLPKPYTPDQAEVDMVKAVYACHGKTYSIDKAECICQQANEIHDPNSAMGKYKMLVHRCSALSAAALELAKPWGCSIRRLKSGSSVKKTCEATAPLHSLALHAISNAWRSITEWGSENFLATDDCHFASQKCCSQDRLGTESARCKDVTVDTLSSNWLDLPPQLQGVFWLQKQGDSSALMSFGRTSDGCRLCSGRIDDDGSYRVRVGGDRQWSFHTVDGKSFMAVELVDLIYDFRFDSPTDPRFAQILPKARNVLGVTLPSWLLSFNMSLMDAGAGPYPHSVTWMRQSSMPVLNVEAESYDYHLVQVIDAAGRRLPAFRDWVAYCEDPRKTGTSSPGKIWFHAYRSKPYQEQTLEQERDACPALLGYVGPKLTHLALSADKALGMLALGKYVHEPDLDRGLYDHFTFAITLALVHESLRGFGGGDQPAYKRMCTPSLVQPLNKERLWKNLIPTEEVDGLARKDCEVGAYEPMSKTKLCFGLITGQLPLEDGMLSPENLWKTVFSKSKASTMEEWIIGQFGDYTNKDGQPVYPSKTVDYSHIYRSSSSQLGGGRWDDLLESHMALDLLGPHLAEEPAEALERGGERAALVVRTLHLAGFERRAGFASWGADMYFSRDGMPLMVVTPEGQEVWKMEASEKEWAYWKWVFRSTLFSAVTLIDHLWFIHMSMANSIATVAREHVSPGHALRRLLSMISFGTIKVNLDANHNLLAPEGILHRASPFKYWKEVHDGCEDNIRTLRRYFEPVANASALAQLPARLRKSPYFQDAASLFGPISALVEGIFDAHGERWCDADTGAIQDQELFNYARAIQEWMWNERGARAADNLAWLQENSDRWLCAGVKKLLKVQMFAVTGFHRHVGTVADWVRDPSLVGLSWAPGETASRPRQAMQFALVAATTSHSMPKLSEDYEFIFSGVEPQDLQTKLGAVVSRFREDLREVEDEVNARNQQRKPPYRQMHPQDVEISVAV